MIVPSIDLMDGHAVQLVQGKEKVLDAGDPRPLAEKFGRVGEVAVIDLDAALGRGSNADVISDLLSIAPCRVGGGIRSVDAAMGWLDAGAAKVILGTAATPEVLSELPHDRTIAALDAWEGEVVVKGWTEGTGQSIAQKMAELEGLVGGYLVTFVETEGKLQGFPRERIAALVEGARGARVTVAGGVTTPDDIAWLDEQGADSQVGMALYTGRMSLADGFLAPIKTDREDGLIATVVTDQRGVALGLVWSSAESVAAALEEGRGIYQSRSRGLWRKGETSGAHQDLIAVAPDCDRDALRFSVRQHGSGFCHLEQRTCFGPARGLDNLEGTIRSRFANPPHGSLTARLAEDPAFLRGKLIEEAGELADATERDHVMHEAADVMYFLSAAMGRVGVTFAEVEKELDRRSLKVTRRTPRAPGGERVSRTQFDETTSDTASAAGEENA